MKWKLAFTPKRLLAFIITALVPMVIIGCGICKLADGRILSNMSIVASFVVPLVAIVFSGLFIFTECKMSTKTIACIVILVVFGHLFLFTLFLSGETSVAHYTGAEAETQYSASALNKEPMPDWSEIGKPVDAEYYHIWQKISIFFAEADHLICRYTPEAYTAQKAALETTYCFQTEEITETHSVVSPAVELDGYYFQLLSPEEYEDTLEYPHRLVLIGYADAACEIVYTVYEDQDLDFIDSLSRFILEDCGWKYVRK